MEMVFCLGFTILLTFVNQVMMNESQCSQRPLRLYNNKNSKFNQTFIAINTPHMKEVAVKLMHGGYAECVGECGKREDCAAAETQHNDWNYCKYLITKMWIPNIEVAIEPTESDFKVTHVDYNDCDPDPCQNGATCLDGVKGYKCMCVIGYEGDECQDLVHGVVNITVDGVDHSVFIDSVDEGRWVVFVKRQVGGVNFAQYRSQYVQGFGDPATDYWIGLNLLHSLTQSNAYELAVDITDFNGDTAWAMWDTFQVAGAEDQYRLTVTGYNASSTAGDSMKSANGQQFSTRDADLDIYTGHCSDRWAKAGWWFAKCHAALPTGYYYPASEAGKPHRGGINWWNFKSDDRSYRAMSFRIRSKA